MEKIICRLRETWAKLNSRQKVLAIGGVCLPVVFIWWIWPTTVEEVVRFDGGGQWDAGSAPPKRIIVWEPAEPLSLPEPDSEEAPASISPALTDAGATLYFSQRANGKPAEIARSRFRDGTWERPESVLELNSPADDMGPVLSRDGRELYFYSNRAEGRGGYDLYVSHQENGVWSKPKNLGPKINTPANEYDPCVGPDGRRLYFSSNRTEQMARRALEGESNSPTEWAGTMRAETGERTYDLYSAARESADENWSGVEPVAGVNLPGSNEGAPHISPDGAFLYFASDRTLRASEATNLDLYRIRLAQGELIGEAENLGEGINTPAHETEPSLSPEGFRLLFASNRDGLDRIYVSTAAEVYEHTTRDASRLKALANPWLWAAMVSIGLLVCAFLLMVSHRGKLIQKVWPARFFAASVLINAVFVLLLFLWKLPGIVDAIVKQFEEPLPASRVVDPETIAARQEQESIYSQVADLPAMENAPTDWPAEITPRLPTKPPANVPFLPIDHSLPLSESLPAHVPQTVVALRPVFSAAGSPAKSLGRSQPKSSVLIPAETPPPLPKRASEVLEKLPNPTSVEKMETASTSDVVPVLPIPSPADLSSSRVVPAPLSSSIALPVADLKIKADLVRSSPKGSPLKQIVKVDEFPKLLAQRPEMEQKVPVEDPKAERQSLTIATAVKLPNIANDPLPLPKKEAFVSAAEKTIPRMLDSSFLNPKIPRRAPLPDRLAMVAKLNQAPELVIPKPGEPREPNPRSSANDKPHSPARRNLAETVSAPPKLNVAAPASKALAKPAELQSSPKPAIPKLYRKTLKPTSGLSELAEPVAIHETVELSAMLSLRNPETRKELAQALGTVPAEEAAVRRGLLWLASHQNEDGSWSLHEFHEHCKKHGGKCSGAGSERSNTAATGLALLPFLAAGYVPGSKEYGHVVAKGLDWLIANQDKDGKLQGKGDNQVMYSHGIAAIALCEAFGMTKDPRLGTAATKAVDFIVKAQHSSSGGWRYNPNEHGDTSVVGWQVMALKSAEMAGIPVPEATYQNVHRWLASVEGEKPIGGVFGYNNRHPSPAMTAEGLLCLEFLSEPRTSPRLLHGTEYLLKYLPEKNQQHTSYYWYYATQVLYHLQGEPWEIWQGPLKKLLVETQDNGGATSGTWTPIDEWERRGGRIYTTAIKLLMLEIDYRHLPLYGSVRPIVKP